MGGLGGGFFPLAHAQRVCKDCNGGYSFTIISPAVSILSLVVWWVIRSSSFNLIISPILPGSGLTISPTGWFFGVIFYYHLSVGGSLIPLEFKDEATTKGSETSGQAYGHYLLDRRFVRKIYSGIFKRLS